MRVQARCRDFFGAHAKSIPPTVEPFGLWAWARLTPPLRARLWLEAGEHLLWHVFEHILAVLIGE
jgi:hypothetical protein